MERLCHQSSVFILWALKNADNIPNDICCVITSFATFNIINVAVIGSKNVGKSAFIRKITGGNFPHKISRFSKTRFIDLKVNKIYTRINFMEYRKLPKIVKFDIIIYLFSLVDELSYNYVCDIHRKKTGNQEYVPEFFCGTKNDLTSRLSYKDMSYVRSCDIVNYFTCSSKKHSLRNIQKEILEVSL